MASNLRKGLPLQVGLSTAFIGVVIFTAIVLSLVALTNLKKNMREDLRTRIHDYIGTAALMIDGDIHKQFKNPDDEKSENYQRMRKSLQQILARGEGVRYVYTMRRSSDGIYSFGVDAEEIEEDMSHIGDVYPKEDVTSTMAQIFDEPGILVEKEISSDQWGTWLSGFAPVFGSDGKLECIIGADISASYILRKEREAMIAISLFILIVTAIAAVTGLIIAKRITNPLSILARNMAEVRNFKLDGTETTSSFFLEIKMISSAFDGMRTGLRSFRRYVPAELVRKLITLGNEATLGGDKQELTVFFSDIADFTSITERIPPEKLSHALERYLGLMSTMIEKNHGTVDKYIGDSVMAFWGAPIDMENHAYIACKTVLQIRKDLKKFNDQLELEGFERLETRIGINTGSVLVGNFGYADRINYTVLGDHVNLASRLESLNKFYNTDILISEHSHDYVKGQILCRLVDLVAVKGRTQQTLLYSPIGHIDETTEDEKTLVTMSAEAFAFYSKKEWNDARAVYQSILTRFPKDGLAQLFLDRCMRLEKMNLPQTWNGVTVLNEK